MNDNLKRLLELFQLNWGRRHLDRALMPFRLGDEIAEGSMALVFEATNDNDGEAVILKVPSPAEGLIRIECEIHDRSEALIYEAQWLARANRNSIDGVVRLVADRTNDALPFLVVDKLGESMAGYIERDGDCDIIACLAMLRDMAGILAKLHHVELYHYDIKPGNILSGDRGWVLVDPSSADRFTDEYFENRVRCGEPRDVLALGRTVLAMYLGYEGEVDVPEGYDIEEYPELRRFIRRMLGQTRHTIPTADEVGRRSSRMLARYFGVPSPRFPIR